MKLDWITMKGTHILVDKDNKEKSIETFLNKHGKSLHKAVKEAAKESKSKINEDQDFIKKLPKQQQKNLEFLKSNENNSNFDKIESPDGKYIELYDKKNKTYSGFFDKKTGKVIFDNEELEKLENEHFKKIKEPLKAETLSGLLEEINNLEKKEGLIPFDSSTYASWATIKNLH